MLLVLDIGNSDTKVGLFLLDSYKGQELILRYQVKTKRGWDEEEFAKSILEFDIDGVQNRLCGRVQGIICVSVVPSLEEIVYRACLKYFGIKPIFVGIDCKIPLEFSYANPKELGADRVVNAVYVKERYGYPAIIVDFGTSTTYCVLDEEGKYKGGLISPGIKVSLDALIDKAEQLSKIELTYTKDILGKSTKEGLCAGSYYSALGSMEWIIFKLSKDCKLLNPTIILTGGFASIISKGCNVEHILDIDLTLKGLEILYHVNRP